MRKLLLAFLLLALPCAAQITRLNYGQYPASGSTTSTSSNSYVVPASGTVSVAAGSAIVMCIGNGDAADTIASITDGTNALTQVAIEQVSGFGEVYLWYKANASVNATAAFTVTYTGGQFPTYNWAAVRTYGGLQTTGGPACGGGSPCDQSSVGTATSATQTFTNVTTTSASELLVGCLTQASTSSTWTPAGTWQMSATYTGDDYAMVDNIVSSTGTYPSGTVVTRNGSSQYASVLGTFVGTGGAARRRQAVLVNQ